MSRPTSRRMPLWLLAVVLVTQVLRTAPAHAIPLLGGLGGPAGYGTGNYAMSDDGSTAAISLATAFPHGLNFYRAGAAYYTTIYVNNNGNVSFNAALSTYTPSAFPGAPEPIIAPWWGDVDTRTAASGSLTDTVWYDVRAGQFTVTWHMVGYYDEQTNLLNDFQMILTDASASGAAGDFNVEFRYNQCQWTTGSASGGVGGFGGTPAIAGFDAGDDMAAHSTTLPGSRTMAILNVCTTSNTTPAVAGDWTYQVRGGGVAVCGNCTVEAGEQCDYCAAAPIATCSHSCHNRLPLGGSCGTSDDCLGGASCVDGVCCNTACTGQCQACNLPGSAGTCSPVAGSPVLPRAACPGIGTTCGSQCDGVNVNTCSFAPTSTECASGTCASGTATAPSYCDGAGNCSAGGTSSCGLYVCGPTGCLTGCMSSADCVSGAGCVGGVCTVLSPPGATCSDGSVCSTGFCIDGVCCDMACNGQCQACDVAGAVGTCSPVTGAPHGGRTACNGTGACAGMCDGTNTLACNYPTSATVCSMPSCMMGTEVMASYCDGLGNCPTPITLSCGALVCGPMACLSMCAMDTDCAPGSACVMGTCTAQSPPGSACTRAGQCLSGNCVDGVCCDMPCNGQCQACDVAGSVGTCTPVMGTPHGTRMTCAGTGTCAGTCNGTATVTCTYPPSSTSCGAASCSGSVAVAASSCNGMGTCGASAPMPCAPFGCSGQQCATVCMTTTDCASGNYCNELGNCVPVPSGVVGCATNADCTSGACYDGVCCDTACTGACQSCRVSGSVGRCTSLPAGSIPTAGADGGAQCVACDGMGNCVAGVDGGVSVDGSIATYDAAGIDAAGIVGTATSKCGCSTLPRPGSNGLPISLAAAFCAVFAVRRRRSRQPRV